MHKIWEIIEGSVTHVKRKVTLTVICGQLLLFGFTSKYHSEIKGILHCYRCSQRQRFSLLDEQDIEYFLLGNSWEIGHRHMMQVSELLCRAES